MHSHLITAYHCLPPVMRSLVATARGARLRHERYGRDTAGLIADALAREQWDRDAWARHHAPRMSAWLDVAATRVPYYRQYWAAAAARGLAPWRDLREWPLLEKRTVREQPDAFVPDGLPRRHLRAEMTSGTTGAPMRLWRSVTAIRQFYAIGELRERLWHGVSVRDRWAIVGGQLVAPVSQRRPPFWVWNGALSQLYMSAYHLSEELAQSYFRALEQYRVTYLWGYPSALGTLAEQALRSGVRIPMRVAVGSAEPVLPRQRAAVARAFGCRLVETYGSTELVAAASECEAGRLHLWPEVGHTEVLDAAGGAVPPGETGELVCTGLLNDAMPLVRYRTGDRGALDPTETPCACGRWLPLLQAVEGRCDDAVITPDGRTIGRLDPVFKSDLPIQEAQIVQEAIDRLRVRVVPAPGFSEASAAVLVARVQERVGQMQVVVEVVGAIARTRLGKFRAVVNELTAEQRNGR